MMSKFAWAALVVCLAACGEVGDVGRPGPAASPTSTSTSTGGEAPSTEPVRSTTTIRASSTTAPTTTPAQGATPLIQAIVADLAAREGVAASDVEVLSTESVDWPDASLGCPEAGTSYIQVVTPGHRIILGIGEATFDYRATVDGRFRICQTPLAGSSNPES